MHSSLRISYYPQRAQKNCACILQNFLKNMYYASFKYYLVMIFLLAVIFVGKALGAYEFFHGTKQFVF